MMISYQRIVSILKKTVPSNIYNKAVDIYVKNYSDMRLERLYRNCRDYCLKSKDAEIVEIGKELNEKGELDHFFGDWTKKYYNEEYQFNLSSDNYYCVEHKNIFNENKMLFFPKGWDPEKCKHYYQQIRLEQDERSPHCYFSKELLSSLKIQGTILDIGVAEGNFALDVVDYANRILLFEPDDRWQIPLKKTFMNCTNVEIIKEKVSDNNTNDTTTISIDAFFGDSIPTDISIIKLDIEGYELQAIHGMNKTLEMNPSVVILVCAYHRQNAEKDITDIMTRMGYSVIHREGYVLFWNDWDIKPPYLRRGVLECRKH